MRNQILTVLFVFLAACGLMACNGGSSGTTGDGSALAKAQELTANANAHWNGIMETFDAVEGNIETFAATPENLAGITDLKIDELKGMVNECFEAPVEVAEQAMGAAEGGDAKGAWEYGRIGYEKTVSCKSSSTAMLDNIRASYSAEASSFMTQKLEMIDLLRKDLRYNLPALIEATPDVIQDMSALMGEILADAESTYQAAINNPLASGEEKAKAESEYTQIKNELQSLEGLLDTMGKDVTDLPMRVEGLMNRVYQDLNNFGSNITGS